MKKPALEAVGILLVSSVAGALWLLWAGNEYRGLGYCPWDSGKGHPVLIALALAVASAVASVLPKTIRASRSLAFIVPVLTAALTGGLIFVSALFFGAGLHCTD